MKRYRMLIVSSLMLLIGGIGGYVVGYARSGIATQRYLLDANAGYLSQQIDNLALLRTGRTDDCIVSIESTLDNAIRQAAWNGHDETFRAESLPIGHLAALRLARMYMEAEDPKCLSDNSRRILKQVNLPEGTYCSPALQELQKKASNDRSGT